MDAFFEDLARRFAAAASKRGATTNPSTLSSEVADEILELARVVAHTTERRFAPLASFVAGAAVDRLRLADPSVSEAALAAYIRSVREELETAT